MTLLGKHKSTAIEQPAPGWVWPALAVLHIPLALAMFLFNIVATGHAYITLASAAYIAFTSREPRKVAWMAAYICGADVLWRMTDTLVFYEMGKYGIVALLGLYLLRHGKFKHAALPILYFLFLILSVPLTVFGLDPGAARDQISFNLSGPLCLAVSVIFFSQFMLTAEDRIPLSWSFTGPLMGIGAISTFTTLTATDLTFTSESNFITSGGFGPNQVSAILSMGTVVLLVLAIQSRKYRWPALVAGLGLLTLSVLTFSRGGLYNVAAAMICAGTFLFRDSGLRARFLLILIPGLLVGNYLIYPRLQEFTGGMLTTRFADTDPTLRLEIMQAEWHSFLRNPLLGTGPGMGRFERYSEFGFAVASHTEYTRMIAEHGIPGILALLLLLVMGINAIRRTPSGILQVWCVAMMAWSGVEMAHSAMRISAIGFAFGLAMAGIADEVAEHEKYAKPRNSAG